MTQTIQPTNRITIFIECFDDSVKNNYVAWVQGDGYDGIVVEAKSVVECMQELTTSIKVLGIYRKNLKEINN